MGYRQTWQGGDRHVILQASNFLASMINNPSSQPLNLLDYESLASQQLSQMAFDYYASGAWDEVTLRDNRAAFDRFRLRPKMLVDVSKRDLTTTILGHILQFPLLIAPMDFQCFANPEGDLATAKAAAKAGVGMILSTLATKSIEEVATELVQLILE